MLSSVPIIISDKIRGEECKSSLQERKGSGEECKSVLQKRMSNGEEYNIILKERMSSEVKRMSSGLRYPKAWGSPTAASAARGIAVGAKGLSCPKIG